MLLIGRTMQRGRDPQRDAGTIIKDRDSQRDAWTIIKDRESQRDEAGLLYEEIARRMWDKRDMQQIFLVWIGLLQKGSVIYGYKICLKKIVVIIQDSQQKIWR